MNGYDLGTLFSVRDTMWLAVAGPLLALTAIVLSIRLVAPQWTRLAAGVRALRQHDPDAEGDVSPGLSVILATVGAYGAAAAVGAATAVSLGGAGAIGWVWLFGIVLAPLAYAEALLARTDAPGKASSSHRGSLARRLQRDRSGLARALGYLLCALILITGLLFAGGSNGESLHEVADRLLPDAGLTILIGVGAVGAVLGGAGARRTGALMGWLGLVALLVLCAAAGWAAMSEPGRAFGTLGRAIGEALDGAPVAEPFVGAFAGEVAFAAMLHALPPLAAPTGMAGAMHGLARARTTRGQAAAAVLGPLVLAVITTVVGMALVATGSYYQRTDSEVSMAEARVYRVAFETASQRDERDRLFTGMLRIREGQMVDHGPELATTRGMIRTPRFEYYGHPADVALRVEHGVVTNMLRPGGRGALERVPPSQIPELRVRGELLPRGGGMLAIAMARGTGSDLGGRLLLAALLALAAVALGVWGIGLGLALPASVPEPARMAVGALPAVGLALSAWLPWLGAAGQLAAGLTVAISCVGLLLLSGQAARLKR